MYVCTLMYNTQTGRYSYSANINIIATNEEVISLIYPLGAYRYVLDCYSFATCKTLK